MKPTIYQNVFDYIPLTPLLTANTEKVKTSTSKAIAREKCRKKNIILVLFLTHRQSAPEYPQHSHAVSIDFSFPCSSFHLGVGDAIQFSTIIK